MIQFHREDDMQVQGKDLAGYGVQLMVALAVIALCFIGEISYTGRHFHSLSKGGRANSCWQCEWRKESEQVKDGRLVLGVRGRDRGRQGGRQEEVQTPPLHTQ